MLMLLSQQLAFDASRWSKKIKKGSDHFASILNANAYVDSYILHTKILSWQRHWLSQIFTIIYEYVLFNFILYWNTVGPCVIGM
jgi:hypothetical protein